MTTSADVGKGGRGGEIRGDVGWTKEMSQGKYMQNKGKTMIKKERERERERE